MKVGYALKIFKILLIIVNTSYFVGIVFMIMADLSLVLATKLGDTDQGFFIEEYDIEDNSDDFNTILLIYFAFTSLSTVGFGDLAP